MQTSTSVSDRASGGRSARHRRGGGLVAWCLAVGIGLVVALRASSVDDGWLTSGVLAAFPWVVAAGAVSTLVVAAAAVAGRHHLRGPAAVLVVVTAVGASLVVPRTSARPQPAATGSSVTVGMLNARIGGADVEHVVEVARASGLDLLAVVEATPEFDAALRDAGLAGLLPTWEQAYEGSVHARGTLRPLAADGVHAAGTPDVLWGPADGGPAIAVTTLHAAAPVGPELTATWRSGVDRTPSPGAGPALVLGDFNATVDHATFRRVLDTGWRDAALEAGRGLEPTYDGLLAGSLALPMAIDHVLVSPGVAVESFTTHAVPGSDHRLVVAELRLP